MEKKMEGGATSKSINHFEQRIVLAIKSQDGDSSYYRVERDKKVQRLLVTYCKAKNLKYHDVAFIYNGVRVQSTKTLLELGMEDGDEIDAMVHQSGGGTNIPKP